MEGYMEDIIFKSKEDIEHSTNLQEAFTILHHYGMRLNLKKGVFR